VIDALGRLPVRGLVTLGGPCKPSDFTPPANVHVVDSAPHGQVLPLASAVVCHGGHGTVMKALAHGLPLVSIPFGRDQLDNTKRVTVHGAGLGVRPSARASTLCAAIERVLGDTDLRRGAMRQRAAIERDRREDPAVMELEALATLASGRSPSDGRAEHRVSQ
jgi:UDP:flavonoid glycosyltransferase YjiC (YdhE family)